MATYRVVIAQNSAAIPQYGWVVEKSSIGEKPLLMSGVYARMRDAEVEALRLSDADAAKA